MHIAKQLLWDKRFLIIAQEVSSWSKDPIYKHGAVIVKERKIVSTGYNGFTKNIKDSNESLNDREFKRIHMIHAEQNAIYNAPTSRLLQGSTIYIAGSNTLDAEDAIDRCLTPCIGCSNGIIQSGIRRVVMRKNTLEAIKKYGNDSPYYLETSLENLRSEMKVCFIDTQ